jgi:hypothetical protein
LTSRVFQAPVARTPACLADCDHIDVSITDGSLGTGSQGKVSHFQVSIASLKVCFHVLFTSLLFTLPYNDICSFHLGKSATWLAARTLSNNLLSRCTILFTYTTQSYSSNQLKSKLSARLNVFRTLQSLLWQLLNDHYGGQRYSTGTSLSSELRGHRTPSQIIIRSRSREEDIAERSYATGAPTLTPGMGNRRCAPEERGRACQVLWSSYSNCQA